MALPRLIFFLLVPLSLFASDLSELKNTSLPYEVEGQMLYLIHRGQITAAFERYLENVQGVGKHNFALLQQAAIRLLEQGMQAQDSEIELMCMFGAGVSLTPSLLPILEKGMRSKDPKIQLVALNYLGRMQDDEADKLLLEALSSPFLLVRLEALFELAKKNHPAVLGHLQSLIVKIPPIIRPLFPQIVIQIDSMGAIQMMRQLLSDSDVSVRVEAIGVVANAKRDDFLPQIRTLASQMQHAEQESSASALGELGDMHAIKILHDLALSKRPLVRLAAASSLYKLGEKEVLDILLEEAREDQLFGIANLSIAQEKKAKDHLATFLDSEERDVRLNAFYSLLCLGDSRAIPHMKRFLITDQKDMGYMQFSSPGGGFTAWKSVPSRIQNVKNYPGLVRETLGFRAEILQMCLELSEETFLAVARMVFEYKQSDLVPILVELLSNHRTEGAIALLKEEQQRAGAQLIRNYCNLALYRLNEEGPYEANLIQWVQNAQQEEMIRFRDGPQEDWHTNWSLSPEEKSQLLINSFEALATAQNSAGIDALIRAIAYGNPKNRYALAGLLMRTTE